MEYAARARRKEKGILTHNNYLGCENINLTYGTARVLCLNQLDQSFSGNI